MNKFYFIMGAIGGVLADALFAPEDISIHQSNLLKENKAVKIGVGASSDVSSSISQSSTSLSSYVSKETVHAGGVQKEKEKSVKIKHKETLKRPRPVAKQPAAKKPKKETVGEKKQSLAAPSAEGAEDQKEPKSVASSIFGFFRGGSSAPKEEEEKIEEKSQSKSQQTSGAATLSKGTTVSANAKTTKSSKKSTLGNGSTKTVTVTEIRFVTVYHTMSLKPQPTSDGGLFSLDNYTRKNVSVGKEKRATPAENEPSAEKAVKENTDMLKNLRKEREQTKKRIAEMEKALSALEKDMVVTKKEAELKEEQIKEKQKEYERDQQAYLEKKESAEKRIKDNTQHVQRAKTSLSTSQQKEKANEKNLKILKTEEKNLKKNIKEIHTTLEKNNQKIISDLKKEIKQEKSEKEALEKGAGKSTGKSPAQIQNSTKLPKGTVLLGSAPRSQTALSYPKYEEVKKSGLSTSEKHAGPEGEKPQESQAVSATSTNNPLIEASATSAKFPIPPFAQNFSNGHLVVSGTPVSSDPDVLKKTQKLFKITLNKAVAHAKKEEKTLAFWGYLTSRFSNDHAKEK